MMSIPLHPMLVHFPIVAWALATVGDLAGLVAHVRIERMVAILLVIGLLSSLVAMGTGLYDYSKIEKDSPPSKVANQHMILMLAATACYTASLFLRVEGTALVSPSTLALSASILGFVSLAAGGHLGATLVYQHGVGVSNKP